MLILSFTKISSYGVVFRLINASGTSLISRIPALITLAGGGLRVVALFICGVLHVSQQK